MLRTTVLDTLTERLIAQLSVIVTTPDCNNGSLMFPWFYHRYGCGLVVGHWQSWCCLQELDRNQLIFSEGRKIIVYWCIYLENTHVFPNFGEVIVQFHLVASLCRSKATCTRHATSAFFGCIRLISWRHVLFWCIWYGLRSSSTCFYIDASDSLPRVRERTVMA